MAEENQENAAGEKTSKMLIIIIIVLLLIIAGGTAWLMMAGSDGDMSAKDSAAEQTAEESGEAAKNFYYYEVDQSLRVNFPKGSSASLIEIRVAFLSGQDDEEALKKHEPMIVNNLLMTISALGADPLTTTDGKNELRRRMLEETGSIMEKMTGRNDIKEVFFTAFVMQ